MKKRIIFGIVVLMIMLLGYCLAPAQSLSTGYAGTQVVHGHVFQTPAFGQHFERDNYYSATDAANSNLETSAIRFNRNTFHLSSARQSTLKSGTKVVNVTNSVMYRVAIKRNQNKKAVHRKASWCNSEGW